MSHSASSFGDSASAGDATSGQHAQADREIERAMPCLIALLALISPRLALIAMWLLSDMLHLAFDGWILPVLGFLLLPWTTLAWAAMWSVGTAGVTGFEWAIVAIAVLTDLGSNGGVARSR